MMLWSFSQAKTAKPINLPTHNAYPIINSPTC